MDGRTDRQTDGQMDGQRYEDASKNKAVYARFVKNNTFFRI